MARDDGDGEGVMEGEEGGGWDVDDDELELPPDLVSRSCCHDNQTVTMTTTVGVCCRRNLILVGEVSVTMVIMSRPRKAQALPQCGSLTHSYPGIM